MTIYARVRTTFSGLHCWPDAPSGKHEHLRNLHRHLFHVSVFIEQKHDDRDIEFLDFKDKLNEELVSWPFILGSKSCEMMASDIIVWVHANYSSERKVTVEVSEDGENGARVEV